MFIKCLLFVSNISKNSQNFTYFPFFTVYIYMLIYAENVFPNKCWYWKIKKHYIKNIIQSKEQLVSEYLHNICTMQNICTMKNIAK